MYHQVKESEILQLHAAHELYYPFVLYGYQRIELLVLCHNTELRDWCLYARRMLTAQ
jgi:hypothetical protein